MKKTLITFIILLLLFVTGCTHNSGIQGSTTNNEETISSVSDFEYRENDEGITISKYIGSAQNVMIPTKIEDKTVTQIGPSAFQYNHAIISVEIPDSVTSIGWSAFSDCIFLSTVLLPQGLKVIDNSAFENCLNLANITLPDTLTTIGDSAFYNCASLTYIKIPKSLTDWGLGIFLNAAIENVDLEDGIKEIGKSAFSYTDIKAVTIPNSVEKISDGAFYRCTNLESVTLNNGLTTIGNSAFALQSKLTEIVIPSSVIKIDETAFYKCNSLQTVKFEGNAPENYQYSYPVLLGDVHYTVYYHEEATGFTSPEWCGYPTAIW